MEETRILKIDFSFDETETSIGVPFTDALYVPIDTSDEEIERLKQIRLKSFEDTINSMNEDGK